MPRHHEERVHEDHHQHLPAQPGGGRPGHPHVRHAGGALPHVAAVPLDSGRGGRSLISHFSHIAHISEMLTAQLYN